jgi:hypothetical protein
MARSVEPLAMMGNEIDIRVSAPALLTVVETTPLCPGPNKVSRLPLLEFKLTSWIT